MVPFGVTVAVAGASITVKGPKGELRRDLHPDIGAEALDGKIVLTPLRQTKKTSALWGLSRTLVANMVEGVTAGFEKKLEFEGIGFRVALEGDTLVWSLGFSHPVRFKAPARIQFKVEKNQISVAGISKELVGETAARIRNLKPPEPYKGKGIRYKGEIIRRKAGKKAVASA